MGNKRFNVAPFAAFNAIAAQIVVGNFAFAVWCRNPARCLRGSNKLAIVAVAWRSFAKVVQNIHRVRGGRSLRHLNVFYDLGSIRNRLGLRALLGRLCAAHPLNNKDNGRRNEKE